MDEAATALDEARAFGRNRAKNQLSRPRRTASSHPLDRDLAESSPWWLDLPARTPGTPSNVVPVRAARLAGESDWYITAPLASSVNNSSRSRVLAPGLEHLCRGLLVIGQRPRL